jgi:Leucine-rich repeat (LRR) protein
VVSEININVNQIEWLDLQHNNIVTIPESMTNFKNLSVLYIHCNYINDMNEIAKLAPLRLRHLTVHGNHIDRIPNFRLYIINIFQETGTLNKVDTVLVTKKERDNSKYWKAFHYKTLPVYELKEEDKRKESVAAEKHREDPEY